MYDDTLKIIIFGDESSGKTTLIQKFLPNLFVSDQTMTIGVDFEVKSLTVDEQKVILQIWDFGGDERFRFLLPTYVRGARGGFFLYDVTNYSSIAHIDDWLSVIRKELREEEKFPILVVGIVPDETIEREVSAEEGIKIAKSRNVNGHIVCNLKTGKNVEKAFEALTRLILADKGYHLPQKQDEDLSLYCYKCNLQLTKEEFLNHPCFTTGAVSLRGAIMGELKQLFSRRVKSGKRGRLTDEEFMILDFESEKVKNLMKQYEEETTKYAIWRGAITKGFIKWLKGEKVKTREQEDLIDRERMSSEKIELFKFIENGIRTKDYVKGALEILARLMLSYRYEYYKKNLERFLEKIKQWEDYDEDRYPYSDILKLFSGDNEYRERFLIKIRRWRNGDKDRYPNPYVFKLPESPDDFAMAPRVQLHASPKKKDPEEKIICQFCGRELTKEEQFTHSCKKKPE
jgi:small GTP-binding protein